MNLSTKLKNIANQGAIDAGASVTLLTSEDDGIDVHFSDAEMQEEACKLVAEYLGDDVYSEDYAGLAQDLSTSESDFEGLLKLYVSNRKAFIERMEARAFVFWQDKILENLGGENV